jgi:DNA-binding MarR family transcriptional regulator
MELMRLLWRLDHGLQARSKRMRTVLGDSGPQRLVLRMLGEFGGLSAGELASLLSLDPSTLTGILGRLEKRRLIVRRPDVSDARRVSLSLTPSGTRINRLHAGTVEGVVRKALSEISRRDLASTRAVLGVLIRHLEAHPSSRLGEPLPHLSRR